MVTMTEKRHTLDRRSNTDSSNISNSSANRNSINSTASRNMTAIDWIAMTLLIIGGINWGLIGLFNIDIVATFFGEMTMLTKLVYSLVGLSALYCIYTASKMGRHS